MRQAALRGQAQTTPHFLFNTLANVQALVVEELRRIHEGVLARYGLRPSDYTLWRARHGR